MKKQHPPVISVISEVLLGANCQDSTIQQEQPAVVACAAMHDRHAHVAHHVDRGIAFQQFLQSSNAVSIPFNACGQA